MIRKYYKLERQLAKDLLEKYHKETVPLVERRSNMLLDLKEWVGLQSDDEFIMERSLMGTDTIVGFIPGKKFVDSPWFIRKDNPIKKGEYYMVPSDTKGGKSFQRKLDKINKIKITTFSNYVIDEVIGGQPTVLNGLSRHIAVAGYHNDTVIMSVPVGDDGVDINDEYPFVEITHSEYNEIVGG